MSTINVLSRTQKIIVDPASSQVTVINAGPIGPGGPAGVSGTVEGLDAAIQAHVDDTTPHPVYDNITDLVVLFNNGLV